MPSDVTVGFDTVKLIQPLERGTRLHTRDGLTPDTKVYGRQGPVWYHGYYLADGETRIVAKGVGASDGYAIWEGSVPKALGLQGVATGDDVRAWCHHLGAISGGLFTEAAYAGRVDVTCDRDDPDGLLRVAALGWSPHARARYVQAVYQDLETVFLHNTRRGVRVYDKHAECGEDWAAGVSRVELQLRSDWVRRCGLRDLGSRYLDSNAAAAVVPLVAELEDRASGLGRCPVSPAR